jgi:flagellar motor switch protein FliG
MDEVDVAELPKIDCNYAAAILLLLLNDGDAAAIMRSFEPSDIQSLGRSMFEAANASEVQIEAALEQFIGAAKAMPTLAPNAQPHIRTVLTTALGSEKADNILETVKPRSDACSFETLKWMEPKLVGQILEQEHPQVGAVILSALDPQVAAGALEDLPEDLQTDLVLRAARLGSVPSEIAADIEEILAQYRGKTASAPKMALGGKADAARIMNKLKKEDGARILKGVKRRDKAIGQQIEDEMFIFENLMELDDKSLGIIMRSVDSAALSLALKGASDALADRILGCMSSRAAQTIRDEMEERGMVKRAEVEEAQRAVIAIVRQLADDGTIMLGGASEDYV